MTPNKTARTSITVGEMTSPLGAIMLAVDHDGQLRAADFADCESRLHLLLNRRLDETTYDLRPGKIPATIKTALKDYFAGDLGAIRRIPVTASGTPFQESVWNALRKVTPGQAISYSELARRLGRPQSPRAVGHANGANPFCIVIPCHRLVGANGALTGYSGGLERKRWLLDHEARHTATA
jgi:methylated-DNA-[protein]-cysteine S-methyltransferase